MAPGKHRPVIYCNDSVNVTSYTVIRVIAINVLTLRGALTIATIPRSTSCCYSNIYKTPEIKNKICESHGMVNIITFLLQILLKTEIFLMVMCLGLKKLDLRV